MKRLLIYLTCETISSICNCLGHSRRKIANFTHPSPTHNYETVVSFNFQFPLYFFDPHILTLKFCCWELFKTQVGFEPVTTTGNEIHSLNIVLQFVDYCENFLVQKMKWLIIRNSKLHCDGGEDASQYFLCLPIHH